MSDAENVAVMRRWFDAVNAHEPDQLAALLADGCVWDAGSRAGLDVQTTTAAARLARRHERQNPQPEADDMTEHLEQAHPKHDDVDRVARRGAQWLIIASRRPPTRINSSASPTYPRAKCLERADSWCMRAVLGSGAGLVRVRTRGVARRIRLRRLEPRPSVRPGPRRN